MSEPSTDGGTLRRILRALGALLGVHVEYARREAATDIGRMVSGVALLAVGVLLLLVAVALLHVAAVLYVEEQTQLNLWGSVLSVGGADVLLALLLMLVGRSRLKRPILVQTRSLVRKTVTSIAEP